MLQIAEGFQGNRTDTVMCLRAQRTASRGGRGPAQRLSGRSW